MQDIDCKISQFAIEQEAASAITPRWSAVPRLWLSRQVLTTTYRECLAAFRGGIRIPAAAERFVNNFHVIEQEWQLANQRLTGTYYRRLPRIKAGSLRGQPRIYAVALSITKFVPGDLSYDALEKFLTTYQTVQVLTIAELRALELTLRIVLLEDAAQLVTGFHSVAEPATRPEEVDNLIARMISLSTVDWQKLLINTGAVDSILNTDPSGVYSQMDLATQEDYRRVVERLAQRTGLSEVEVARQAVDLALVNQSAASPAESHAGFYLIDDGLAKLKQALNYRATLAEKIRGTLRHHATALYFSTFVIITAVLVTGWLYAAFSTGARLPLLLLVLALSIIPVSEVTALGLRLLVLFVCHPRRLPRIEISPDVTEAANAIVVVPTILSSLDSVHESLETIEGHYLANQDRNIFFALLTDWRAAPTETMPDDDVLLAATVAGIEALNSRYGAVRFHLFHRRRLWNQSETEWIGWEKKRGKLREFNRLLRGGSDTSYVLSTATAGFLKQIKFVITLDSDTELPRDGARKLIGTILHPLNRPELNSKTGFIKRGYAILQPLVSSPPPKASDLPRILSGYLGVTHRTTPASLPLPNFYQDLWAEGNYVGKALYDVDAFEACLQERIPDNSLLSHDLLEGLYARTGIVADLEIFDEPPAHYMVHSKRAQRWTRGDWQLLPWLFPKVRNEAGVYTRNVLPAIARWKIFDNLRRSLVKPAALLFFIAAWTIFSGAILWWTLGVLLLFVTPTFLHFAAEVITQAGRNRQSLLRNAAAGIRLSVAEALFATIYLPHQAYLTSDAIVRTLYRLFWSHRRLLEWTTADSTRQSANWGPRVFVRYMWPASLVAAVIGLIVGGLRPTIAAVPFVIVWIASPLFAYSRSRRLEERQQQMKAGVNRNARLNAHHLWSFFKTASPASDASVATLGLTLEPSSANLGRLLLWIFSAHEIGAITTGELRARLESALGKFHSPHSANGSSRRPLITSVQEAIIHEVGSPSTFLTTLSSRCNQLISEPIFDRRVVAGIADSLLLIRNEFVAVSKVVPSGQGDVFLDYLHEELLACRVFLEEMSEENAPRTTSEWRRFLRTMAQRAAIIELIVKTISQHWPAINLQNLCFWSGHLVQQTRSFNEELCSFAPWLSVRTSDIDRIRPEITDELNRVSSLVSATNDLPAVVDQLSRLRAELDCEPGGKTQERQRTLERVDELTGSIEQALETSRKVILQTSALAIRCQLTADSFDFPLIFDTEYRLLRNQFYVSLAPKKGVRI